jgi:transcriptional/translational regulatory protein YebC/TACO1
MDAGIVFLAENTVTLSDEQLETTEKLVEALEEDDDVDEVWSNV